MSESPTDAKGPSPEGGHSAFQAEELVIRQFVEHWGMMARSWGINSTMGELFALLYITGSDWTADELREWLRVSRGNVSMNLRELMAWGVVHKTHKPGERKEYFQAEADVWTLFRRILAERKRRELDPTLELLQRTEDSWPASDGQGRLHARIEALRQFFSLFDLLAAKLLTLDSEDLAELRRVFDLNTSDPPERP